jgi:Zn-dependent peptidase ImmA (M78 family)
MRKRLSDREFARNVAHALLDRLGIESADHPQIETVAHRLGVELVETRLDGARAQLVVGRHGPRILLSDQSDDPEDRNWSIAHELGHYVCAHPAPPAAELCVPRPSGCSYEHPDEDAANSFASVVLMPPKIVAAFCDRTPMTINIPMQLAETCGVTWEAAALRVTESSWRICALVFSQHGQIQWIAPSLPFVMLCGQRLRPGRLVGPGALARRFFDTGVCPDDPALVPTSAWVAGCGPEARLLEHSVANREHGAVMTILWDPADTSIVRPAIATLPFVTAARDYLLDELNDEATAKRRNEA